MGNDPRVNNICFCLPLFFFPFGPPALVSPDPSPSCANSAGVLVPLAFVEFFPEPQAGCGGVVSPAILFSDWLPLIAVLGNLGAAAAGSSGNADFDNDGGADDLVRAPGPGTEVGPRMTGGKGAADEDEDAHGVLRCPVALAPGA